MLVLRLKACATATGTAYSFAYLTIYVSVLTVSPYSLCSWLMCFICLTAADFSVDQ